MRGMADQKHPVTHLKINRRTWLRGTKEGTLRDNEDKMCCLGFYARACGYKVEDLYQAMMPDELVDPDNEEDNLFPEWVFKTNNEKSTVNRLVYFNDSEKISDKVREEKIAYWFAREGVKVTFTGRKPSNYDSVVH